MKFKIQLETMIGAPPWEYEYEMASYPRGLDYAKHVVGQQFASISWFVAAVVSYERHGEWHRAARVTIEPATAVLETL